MFSGLPCYSCVEQFLARKFSLDIDISIQTFKLQITLRIFFIKLSKGRHLFVKLMFMTCFSGSMFFRIHIFQIQVFEGPGFRNSPKVALCFKLFNVTS